MTRLPTASSSFLFFLLLAMVSVASPNTLKGKGFLRQLENPQVIQERINERYNKLFHRDDNGKLHPFVCVACDILLVTDDDNQQISLDLLKRAKDVLVWSYIPDPDRKPELEEKFEATCHGTKCRSDLSFLKGMALSPRAVVYKKQEPNSKWGFSCCKRCKGDIGKVKFFLPRHAILNKNYVGCAPQALLDLNEVEIAFLSPVKNYGYCFVHTGGTQQVLKGSCTFMRVTKEGIANSVSVFEDLGLNKHTVVLFTGKLTKEQKKKAKSRSEIRTDKVIAAMHWLVLNNRRWSSVDLDKIKQALQQHTPVIIDRSEEAESENANIESESVFTVFYPDGATKPTTAGLSRQADFKKVVHELAESGYDINMRSELEKQFTKEGDSSILMDACLLQFPYGVGGMDEDRLLHDGSITNKSDLVEYFDHLSKLSQNVFQKSIFQLIMYSMISRCRILRASRLQLKGKTDADNLSENFDPKEVLSLIKHRRRGNYSAGTAVAAKFIRSVEACSKALPHTNDATKSARANGESMQHHFGMASGFATVTFDDENSILMQVYTGIRIDDDKPIESLSDEELGDRANERRSLRLEYPGIAALNFEILFRILLEEVFGWDIKHNKATEIPGLVGLVYALCYAIEEQGRKTLHGHLTFCVEGYKELQHNLFHGSISEKSEARQVISKYHEHVADTELFPTSFYEIKKAFDHKCSVPLSRRQIPQVVNDQGLRNLRNRHGYKDTEGRFASCPDCNKQWSYEGLLSDYLVKYEDIRDPNQPLPVFDVSLSSAGTTRRDVKAGLPRARMFGKVIEYQQDLDDVIDPPLTCINAAYQHHYSCHVSGCFRCQKKGVKDSKHVCGPQCECRYRLPDLPRLNADVVFDDDNPDGIPWFTWSGELKHQPLAQVLPKRNRYDLFQNVSMRAVSHSKFSCNSNISLILDGPVGQYMHKYQLKNNQEEETHDYHELDKSIKKFNGERVHEDNRREALRRICRGAFANNRKNVISACFASYLIRNPSRFYYSHTFQFCPLKDVVRLHNKKRVQGELQYSSNGRCYFENQALNYFCRSKDLEQESLYSITESYKSVSIPFKKPSPKKKKKESQPKYRHVPSTAFFEHSSVLKSGPHAGECQQGYELRVEDVLPKVCQWQFPDTADFKADICTAPRTQWCSSMEKYAQHVLALFMPHRCKEDLTVQGSAYPYLEKFQQVWNQEEQYATNSAHDKIVVFNKKHLEFLQNMQNCRSNSLRYKVPGDPLSRKTVAYDSPNAEKNSQENQEEDEEPEVSPYQDFTDMLEEEMEGSAVLNDDPEYLPQLLQSIKFKNIRNKGTQRCGWKTDLEAPTFLPHQGEPFVKATPVSNGATPPSDDSYPEEKVRHTCNKIVKLHLRRNQPVKRKVVFTDKDEEVAIKARDATGSVKSVREWAKAVFGQDAKQRRAFEAITSAFLLTFYDEDPEVEMDATQQGSPRTKYRKMKKALQRLRGSKDLSNFICLLHGSGGSGKSTVINCVMAYAQDYCEQLDHPFTDRTIIVSAMSGVAATLLKGETTHSVLGLNKEALSAEEVELFADTRMIIIDEISFAADEDFEKMHEHLKEAMESDGTYGGIAVVFAGDFSQMEPVGRDPVYKNGRTSPYFQNAINCYIELEGKWRFKDDPFWGDIMARFREGEPTHDDITTINQRLVHLTQPERDIQIAAYRNKDRCAVNTAIFEDYVETYGKTDGTLFESAFIIFADNLYCRESDKSYVPVTSNGVKKYFYENVTESDVDRRNGKTTGRFDPCLKLYQGAPVMFTKNEDVGNGQANGSRCRVKQVHMKANESPFELTLQSDVKIRAAFASQVKSIEVEHENQDINPRRFQVEAKEWTFRCKVDEGLEEELWLGMKAHGFPLVNNNCTTGHKLQGCTVLSLLVNDWHYKSNWPYVVLSRVRTLAGLFLREPLSMDLKKYKQSKHMKNMIQTLRINRAVLQISDQEYKEMEALTMEDS